MGSVLELPPCPNDMDEPLYAALVFSQRCFVGPNCAASHIPLISGYRNAVRMARFGWTTLSVSACVNSATRTSKCAPRRLTMYLTDVSCISALLKARKCLNQCHNRGATSFARLSSCSYHPQIHSVCGQPPASPEIALSAFSMLVDFADLDSSFDRVNPLTHLRQDFYFKPELEAMLDLFWPLPAPEDIAALKPLVRARVNYILMRQTVRRDCSSRH